MLVLSVFSTLCNPGTCHSFKVGLPPSKKKIICFNDKPSKMMKDTFYFILKALFVLKIFRRLPWLFGHAEKKGLIKKIRLTLKFMTSQPG